MNSHCAERLCVTPAATSVPITFESISLLPYSQPDAICSDHAKHTAST